MSGKNSVGSVYARKQPFTVKIWVVMDRKPQVFNSRKLAQVYVDVSAKIGGPSQRHKILPVVVTVDPLETRQRRRTD